MVKYLEEVYACVHLTASSSAFFLLLMGISDKRVSLGKPCLLQGQKALDPHLNKSGWIFKANLGSHR